jgi:hypothetical protein
MAKDLKAVEQAKEAPGTPFVDEALNGLTDLFIKASLAIAHHYSRYRRGKFPSSYIWT